MSILAEPLAAWTAGLYFASMVAIGLWAARRTKTVSDFFVAGRSIGLLVTGIATMSAAFSGFVFLGGPGLVYRMGVGALFICVSASFTSGLLCWVAAKRLRLLAEARPIFTLPDAFAARFDSRAVSALAAVAVLLGCVAYLGAQLQALGLLVEAVFGTREAFGAAGPWVAMGIGLAVILLYSVAGGMIAGVYTDVVQGLLMMVAATAVFAYALSSTGGLGALTSSILESPEFGPGFLDPLGGVPVATAIGFFFIFSVGTLGQPHMLHKFLMLDEVAKLKWMPAVIGVSQTLCILIWVGIGLAVPALVGAGRLSPLAHPDDAALTFLAGFTPDLLTGFVLAGVLAAIMSSADSFVNVASAALVRDLPRAFGRRLPAARELPWARLAVVGIALAAAACSLLYGDLIALLGTFAFATFGAALAPVVAIGLNWKRVPAGAAAAAIATGLTVNLGLELVTRSGLVRAALPPGVLPGTVALAASFAVLLVWSWLAPRRQPLAPDVALSMEL